MPDKDPTIRPFFRLVEKRLQAQNRPPELQVLFRKKPDMACTVRLDSGKALVQVTDELRSVRNEVDQKTVNESLKEKYARYYHNLVNRFESGEAVDLNVIASVLFGPLSSPLRKAQTYFAYREFWTSTDILNKVLGPKWEERAKRENESGRDGLSLSLIQVRVAAQIAAEAGLLELTSDDEPEDDMEDTLGEVVDDSSDDTDHDWDGARNEIYFGPPGTGKSFEIDQRLRQFGVPPERLFRVTFHPEYTYFDLVGGLRPCVTWVHGGTRIPEPPKVGQPGEPRTYYDFVPGPLSLALRAVGTANGWTALIIEEINRGNCAAIFGDVFQLLDRRTREGTDFGVGWSMYSITPPTDWSEWLRRELPEASQIFTVEGGLRLPPKLLILASMNTSDQNLFPLDTAFRRRWSMRYVGIHAKRAPSFNVPLSADPTDTVPWGNFLKVLNERIVQHTRSDDKQLGPWFIHPRTGQTVDTGTFKSKVLYYLWADIFANEPGALFQPKVKTYDNLIALYEEGQHVFNEEIMLTLKPSNRAPATNNNTDKA